jgi:hypothetical protein
MIDLASGHRRQSWILGNGDQRGESIDGYPDLKASARCMKFISCVAAVERVSIPRSMTTKKATTKSIIST